MLLILVHLQQLKYNSSGTANLTAASGGGTINMSSAGSSSYNLIGGAGVDTLTGDGGNDTFTISSAGQANSDTLDGGAHSGGAGDTIQLSSGSHSFTIIVKL